MADTPTQVALLGEAVDAMPLLVFVADDAMRYVAVNRYACEVLGYTRDELLGLRVTDVAPAPAAPAEYEGMVEAGSRAGVSLLRTREGGDVTMRYRAVETHVGDDRLWVSVGWLE